MYIYIMHYLNFFLLCSIKNLNLLSVSRLSIMKSAVRDVRDRKILHTDFF